MLQGELRAKLADAVTDNAHANLTVRDLYPLVGGLGAILRVVESLNLGFVVSEGLCGYSQSGGAQRGGF